ncbi:molybdate ABC transporter substrate-binding protein [Nitrincola tibetensis]|uniref:Molybdate ABC transporter substrate-binding protein n=1 Tax=Nitrincola tibetensis TaxID=2219697 RepID=A0A364NR97_9GAMM|nr:molybdate ABC transporter substrate-binding protein [Nitrincola tibetensis]RAU19639.1 molybdate ABC transporter substrate-binding protein [Nitrincola tibetensis]
MPLILMILLLFSLHLHAAPPVRIAAAADLQLALPNIEKVFKETHPDSNISITFGSSGVFTSQLRQGAPFELFFSANSDFVQLLYNEGHTLDAGTRYAFGRLAFYTQESLVADSASEAITLWHQQARSSHKLSIANPQHAPYGMAAIDWLQRWSLEEQLKPRLVLGENAAQSVQFVLSGAARSGVVAWPLLASRQDLPGLAWLIPESEHIPLEQKMVLMKNAGPTAQRFYHFMQTETAKKILIDHGFGAP